jgi:hypothetical protein
MYRDKLNQAFTLADAFDGLVETRLAIREITAKAMAG